MSDAPRRWIKTGDDPLRFEYGRENKDPFGPQTKDVRAYVEREFRSYASWFRWETYTAPHHKGLARTRLKAQEAAMQALKR